MRACRIALRPVLGLLLLLFALPAARAAPDLSALEALPLYKMVRTLEYVQDSIVTGDHAAMPMQQYLLKAIDHRLRAASASDFDDPRNVDAALIYAMSGGNPQTLALLAAHDVTGHFDQRLTDALSTYFSGEPEQARPALEAIEEEFRDTAIGPYLTLVTANAMVQHQPKKALVLYDWVRLLAPGSILEEAALRRSLELSLHLKLVDKGLDYARLYAERFLHSPYAGQFADMFVRLMVDNDIGKDRQRVFAILTGMDEARQREIYLRIARRAAIAGRMTLAQTSAERAAQLSSGTDTTDAMLAGLYGAMARLPSAGVRQAMASLETVPAADLSPRDRELRAAALTVGREVIAPPTTDDRHGQGGAASEDKIANPVSRSPIPSHPIRKEAEERRQTQKTFEAFVDARRAKLKAVDMLLEKTDQ